jgi:hypothetical protein
MSEMQPVLPAWFKQRQGKAELARENTFRLTAPNMGEAFISIQRDQEAPWSATLRQTADGPLLAATQAEFPTPIEAWEAAFELYRISLVT